jgi:hypothetical protein
LIHRLLRDDARRAEPALGPARRVDALVKMCWCRLRGTFPPGWSGVELSEGASPKLVQAAFRLQSAAAVRERANRLLNLGVLGQLEHFAVDLLRLDAVLDIVVKVTRSSYADLSVPPYARWRHFEVGEVDRWGMLASSRDWKSPYDLGRAAVDLAFISILVDGLAGPGWAYAEAATGETFARGEGLAIASLVMFAGGTFSSDPYDPLRVDARALAGLTIEELSDGLQQSQSNALVGLEPRLAAINRFGQYMAFEPELFTAGESVRPGGLIDYLGRTDAGNGVSAPKLMQLLLKPLNTISPGRYALGGIPLGDTSPHARLVIGDDSDALMPFHQTAQWLTYSLIEPLVWAGFDVFDLDGLTALADQWNGGLLLDMGLIKLRNPTDAQRPHPADSELVVEFRALTVALIDKVADGVRKRLGRPAETFPLACVLEGGTSAAGRRLARERRADGSPALVILPDTSMI